MNFDPHGRLHGVHPDLVGVVTYAASICKTPFIVLEGVRSAERQADLFAQGRTRPGPEVTRVKVSNHQVKPDGYGHAVDLATTDEAGKIDWHDDGDYDTVAESMMRAAKQMGISIRWGADWDMDGVAREHGETDLGHFELHGDHYA